MSRKQFTSRNNIGSVLTFQKSGVTSSFDPTVLFIGAGSRRVSWKLDNGSNITQTAGNSIIYTGFTSDPGIRTIEMRGNSFRNITQLSLDNENLYGHIDLSRLNSWGSSGTLALFTNPNLTGITNPSITGFTLGNYQVFSTGIVGNLDMSPITVNIQSFVVDNNPALTGITHNTTSRIINTYQANNCNLTGNLNLPYTGMTGTFQVQLNPNLTGITHAPSSQNITTYFAHNCNLTGNLDLTPLSGLGGFFRVHSNSGLTSITHVPSSQIFANYLVYNCNLTGNLDLTPLSGLGGAFWVYGNSGLTSITHSVSSQIFSSYLAYNCNLTGNLDLTPLSGLGGSLQVQSNPNLTGITHSPSSQNFSQYQANTCNLTGTLDLSPLTKLGASNSDTSLGNVLTHINPNLTNIIFPNSTQFFKNSTNSENAGAFALHSCNLDYIDFTPLSGATLLSGTTQGNPRISLRDNNMIAADVNHILVDFANIATINPTGWSNINLNISGTNAAPDSSSGGYDGIAARDTLTGSPYNWTITHS
jgi:hypothetical protein